MCHRRLPSIQNKQLDVSMSKSARIVWQWGNQNSYAYFRSKTLNCGPAQRRYPKIHILSFLVVLYLFKKRGQTAYEFLIDLC